MYCPLVFDFPVGIGGFVIGLGQISFFFSEVDASLNITCRKLMITYCVTKSHHFKIFDWLVQKRQDIETETLKPHYIHVHKGRVYVLTRVATRVVERACAMIISLKRDSTYSGRFQTGGRNIFH